MLQFQRTLRMLSSSGDIGMEKDGNVIACILSLFSPSKCQQTHWNFADLLESRYCDWRRIGQRRNCVSILYRSKRFFSFPQSPDRLWAPITILFGKYRVSFLGTKAARARRWPLIFSSADIINGWICASTPPTLFFICLEKKLLLCDTGSGAVEQSKWGKAVLRQPLFTPATPG
jgi:hypothetical protein